MIIVKELARCLVRGCPARYVTGEDRLCHDHENDTVGTVSQRLAALAGEAPVGSREVTQSALFTRSGQVATEGESP